MTTREPGPVEAAENCLSGLTAPTVDGIELLSNLRAALSAERLRREKVAALIKAVANFTEFSGGHYDDGGEIKAMRDALAALRALDEQQEVA